MLISGNFSHVFIKDISFSKNICKGVLALYNARVLNLSNFFVFENNNNENINFGDSILSLYEISDATLDNLTVINNYERYTTTVLKIINSNKQNIENHTKVLIK